MEVFISEHRFKDGNKGRLKHDHEVLDIQLSKGLTIFARIDFRVSL